MTTSIAKSLTLKWMAFSILLATIPLAIAGFSIIQIYQQDLKKSIIEIEKEKAQLVVERTEAFFEKALSNLLLLSREENLGKGGLSNTKGHFENVLYNNDYLVELTLLDKKGQETFKISKYRGFDPSDLKNRSKSKMFEVASKGQTYYGEFHLTTDVVPTIVIAVPIEEYRGKPFAVLSAKIHLRYLWDLLPQTQIGKEGSTYVVNKEGDLIAHPDTRRVLLGLNIKDRPMVKQVVEGKEGYLEFEHPQEGRNLVIYKPIRRLGWGVIVQVPVEEAYKPLRQVANTALKWILVALTIAIIFSLFLTKKLTLPIKRLSKEMGEVAKGNLNTYIQRTSKDEIGLLTESFNHMIQDLKQSHEALKKAEEKYRSIFENAVEGIFQIGREGRFLSVNPALATIHGYESPEEFMNTITDVTRRVYLNPDDRLELIRLLREKKVVHNFETQVYRKDGGVIWISMNIRGIYDSVGRFLYYVGHVQDVTGRKRAEEELQKAHEMLEKRVEERTAELSKANDLLKKEIAERRRTEEQLREASLYARSLIEASLDPLVTITPDGKIMDVNKAMELVTGVSRKGLIGGDFTDYFTEPEKARRGYQQALLEGFLRDYPLTIRHMSSQLTDVLYNATVYRNEAGKVQGIFASARDITERKRMEEARARLAAIVESSNDAIIGKDLDGSILSWNSGAERIYGYTAEEIIGKSLSILVPPDYPNEVLQILERIKKGEGIENYETVRMRKDGRRIDVSLTVSPIKDDTDKIMGASTIARDITERKQMQEKLLISERLATLGLFSGSISHELKNPLSTIDSSVYYLKTKLKDADEKVRTHLDRIKSSVGSGLAIIDSLRNLTQMKEPRLERLDLISITFDAIVNSQVPGTVNVMRNITEQEVLVNADPGQLRMAFKNIVNNAVQAMDGKGTLEVTVRKIDGQAEVSFTDTGPGIAPENLDKIFQPLFSTKAKGLGFGLSIAKMVIDKHSSTIEAQSEPGKGATILIRLPLYIQS